MEKKTEEIEENRSLEETFDSLDQIIEKMEGTDLPLEETFELYKQGISLIEYANKKIEKVETDIRVINDER